MKILLFGPDKSSVLKLASPLEAAGFDCDILFTQKKMVEFLSRISTYDFPGVVILGEGISGKVRSSFLEQVTEMVFSFPVLHVVSPDAFETIFEGMATKMMDYICLPVRSKELVTRTGILIRQAYPERVEEQTLRYGPYVFSRYPDRASFRGRNIPLSAKEYRLGRFFFDHLGRPLSRMTLSEAIWNSEEDEFSRTIDTHVSRVRNKLALNEKNGFSLEQVYGFGYQLTAVQALV